MIDEAIGKILGMVMAYAASALGMLVAYANYRKRTLKADQVMTPAAWMVVLVSVLAVGGGALLVVRLAQPTGEAVAVGAATEEARETAAGVTPAPAETARPAARESWPWAGIVVPAAIFLFATVITAALHRHFARVEAHG
jgi:hypothetical protein